MTERTDRTRLHDWLDETVGQTPDPVEGTRRVMSQVEETPQAGRWLPFPLFDREARRPTAADTVDYLPSPLPATNNHTPTAIERTHAMLSLAKAITAAALVFALGGVLLITQPSDRAGGDVPSAATGVERAAPVEINGGMVRPCLVAGTGSGKDPSVDVVGSVEQRRGGHCNSLQYVWSDPRLDGAITDQVNVDEYLDGSGLMVATRILSIENDGGAWRMRPLTYVLDADLRQGNPEDYIELLSGGDVTWVLDGEGAYEGLVAVVRAEDSAAPYGFIIDGDVPPPPDVALTD